MSQTIAGGSGKTLEEYFGPEIDKLSTRNLSKELILLGNNKEAHTEGLITIEERMKYNFLVKECRKRKNYPLNELISDLYKQYVKKGPKINYEQKYNVNLDSYNGISWGEAHIDLSPLTGGL